MLALPDLNGLKRVLIIRLSSIGDVANALPVAAALKDSFPHLELTWIVEEMSADIVVGSPCLNKVIVVPRNRWKRQGRLTSPGVWMEYLQLLKSVRAGRFDLSLDLQGYAKSALLALASGARYRLAWDRLRDGAGIVSKALPREPQSVHRVDLFLDVPRALGAVGNPVRFPLHIPEESREYVRAELDAGGVAPNQPYAVINPSSGSPTRRWPAASYSALAARVAERFRLAVVLVGSGKDREICAEVARLYSEAASGAQPMINLAGKTDIKQLAAVLDRCSIHVCGDTGSAHIAAALQRPVVALFGPTDPALAGPWGQQQNVIAHREHCAAGCGVRQCAVAGEMGDGRLPDVARCLTAITLDEVVCMLDRVMHG